MLLRCGADAEAAGPPILRTTSEKSLLPALSFTLFPAALTAPSNPSFDFFGTSRLRGGRDSRGANADGDCVAKGATEGGEGRMGDELAAAEMPDAEGVAEMRRMLG